MIRVARILSIVAVAGWVGSLSVPALSFQFDGQRDQILFGWQVLTSGFFHLAALEFSWLANFAFAYLLWVIWFRPAWRRALLWGAVAIVLLTAQSLEIFVLNEFFQHPRPFAGYFLWFASNVLIALSALVIARSESAHLVERAVQG